ncbi:hypothetical protein ICN84_01530 [Akkermansia glycaniphila]|uniref:hypothetical protein n=1 Tax=Akkermansia glycaniphila TaxID=1679444 RepID=UPI001C031F44|nr:hypothetical protein [Akkermansia glycaniphila]MBT9448751.1 hypothetical protein [Akkermansia glycaniphila]
MKTKRIKNITRYSYKAGQPFNGYRLAVSRNRKAFIKYFSDRKYGSAEEALKAALACKEEYLAKLAAETVTES